MSDNHEDIEGGRGTARSGLRRLMLKLPAHRQQLQSLTGLPPSPLLGELFEAYDEACTALERFRQSNDPLVQEYEAVCAELEAEIILELKGNSAS